MAPIGTYTMPHNLEGRARPVQPDAVVPIEHAGEEYENREASPILCQR